LHFLEQKDCQFLNKRLLKKVANKLVKGLKKF